MATFNPSLGPAKGGSPPRGGFNPVLKGRGPFKPSLGGSYGELSPIRPGTRPPTMGGELTKQPRLPMPTVPGNGNPGPLPPGIGSPVPGSGGTWSNPFIPSPRDGNRLPKQPYPRNGGFPGGSMKRNLAPGGNLQEIARRRLQKGI